VGRQTADKLHSAALHLLRAAAAADAGMRLDGPRASLLSILAFAGPQTMSRLAEMERVTPAAVTKLVTALERQGLAVRVRDDTDRRLVRVHATEAGIAILSKGRAARVKVVQGLLRGLSKDELGTLDAAAAIMERMVRAAAASDTATPPHR
jgi:DNA-binding MarR family transcriptional regulator